LLAADMVVAILTVHLANGFFVSDGGYELVLLLAAAALYFALRGPGQFSLDAQLTKSTAYTGQRTMPPERLGGIESP